MVFPQIKLSWSLLKYGAFIALLAVAFGVSWHYSSKYKETHEDLLTEQSDRAKEVGELKAQIQTCTETKQTFTKIYENLQDNRSLMQNALGQSQRAINVSNKQREQLLTQMNAIDLSNTTCAEKLQWLKKNALANQNWNNEEAVPVKSVVTPVSEVKTNE